MIDPEIQPSGTARVGAELRGVRERLGWKLPDIAAQLFIRDTYLDAIERGDLAFLPGPAYQTGFVRSYAQALGLDPDEILRRFRAEGAAFVPKADLTFLSPVPDRAVPTGALVLLGVVLLLAGYGLWYTYSEHQRELAALVPAVPAELAPLAVPKPAPAPVKLPPLVALAATAASPATPVAAPATPPVVAPPVVTPPVVAAVPALPAASSGQTIMAIAADWIEVKDPTGNILFSKVLQAGDSWPVPQIAGLIMTAGNAGGTEIVVNGKAGAPLGTPGSVLRSYKLTPAAPNSPVAKN